jgi:hypothetical protein
MSDVFSYSNKRVVVTGGASGVGAALVEHDRLGEPEVIVLDVREPSVSSSQRWLPTHLTSPAPTRHLDEWPQSADCSGGRRSRIDCSGVRLYAPRASSGTARR